MKTILIAEDEKLIRKGLIAMIKRTSVPVDVILEARDGEEALSILKQNEVDLLITDIRMPKMNGIELVSRLSELERQPLVLVISGYDDFSYAVEMLRMGIFDYLLKPVERERFYSVMEKLEEQYQMRMAAKDDADKQLLQALRQLMIERDTQSSEWREQLEKYRGSFFTEPYIGFCARDCEAAIPDFVKKIHGIVTVNLYAAPVCKSEQFADLLPVPLGKSGEHNGLEDLHVCYQESYSAWQRSFFAGKLCAAETKQFQPLNVTAQQLTGLIGLAQYEKAYDLLETESSRAAKGEIDPNAFAQLCEQFIAQLFNSYQNIIDEWDSPERFAVIWDFENSAQYLSEFKAWLQDFCSRTELEFADFENKQKIREAVQYIQQNFQKPLSMTIVSNEVSMNYSLFSLLFKQYTGVNFVNYLQNLRIEEAKRLLETTDWRVNEICSRSSFSDEKHFLKVFKAAVGFSPTEYRKSKLLIESDKE